MPLNPISEDEYIKRAEILLSSPSDMVRINRVENGYIISARRIGTAPQSYAYTDRAIAHTVDEVCAHIRILLAGSHNQSNRSLFLNSITD